MLETADEEDKSKIEDLIRAVERMTERCKLYFEIYG